MFVTVINKPFTHVFWGQVKIVSHGKRMWLPQPWRNEFTCFNIHSSLIYDISINIKSLIKVSSRFDSKI